MILSSAHFAVTSVTSTPAQPAYAQAQMAIPFPCLVELTPMNALATPLPHAEITTGMEFTTMSPELIATAAMASGLVPSWYLTPLTAKLY